MREIKFRGKMLDGGRWIYGSLLTWPDGETYILYDRDFATTVTMSKDPVRPETVGQYTGLKDKKDHEIYDGDIIFVEFADKSGGNQLVGWNEETASWGIMGKYEYQSLMDGDDWPEFKNHTLLAFLKHAIVCEVVGNIHDNPELLKED